VVTLQHLVDQFVRCRGRSPGLRVPASAPAFPAAGCGQWRRGRARRPRKGWKLPDHSGEGRSGLGPQGPSPASRTPRPGHSNRHPRGARCVGVFRHPRGRGPQRRGL